MPSTYKILGQAIPAGGVLAVLYTVPALTSLVGSSIVVCNQLAVSSNYRISVAVAGAADTPMQYLAFDVELGPRATQIYTIGLTLAATDVVRCQSNTGAVSFNLFGSEET